MPSFRFVVAFDVHVAVNNTKPFSVAMETQQWFTDADNTNVLKSSRKLRSIFIRI